MSLRRRNIAVYIVLAVFLLSFLSSRQVFCFGKAVVKLPFKRQEYHYVKKVFDGDTILLASGEKVRLLGIDTPEMHDSDKLLRDSRRSGESAQSIKQLGRKSYQFARDLLEGKMVSLEFDVQKYDKYGRLLAYVYLEDGTFVNAKIIEEGYADLMTIPPNLKYADLFKELLQKARDKRKGLWE